VTIEIERVVIALHGVSALVAEAAVADLAEELRRRLSPHALSDLQAVAISELALESIETTTVLDAAALRGIIAERVIEALSSVAAPAAANQEGSE
jgi:hypothetical protein